MYRLLGLRVLLGTLLFFAIFGGSIVSIAEQYFRRKCPNILWRTSFAIVATVVTLAIVGLVIAGLPLHLKHNVSIAILSLLFVFGIWRTVRARTYRVLADASAGEIAILVAYGLFCGSCLWLALAAPTMPQNLPDGAYVSKEDTRGVQIQYLTGNLPADNALPLVVAEYFLRNISFHDNHPIMPGQEVSNRPVLAAAAVTPVLASIAPPRASSTDLPKFSYVGIDWPDFRVLVRDNRVFAVYLAFMIPLNAAILLGAAAFFNSSPKLELSAAITAVCLFVTSPYFIFQTIFTWPKELAAFFVLFAMALMPCASAFVIGILVGLAYLSHPYAGAFLVGSGIYYLTFRRNDGAIRQLILLAGGFAVAALPWLLWVRRLDLPSDLVSQNMFVAGQTWANFAWVRVINLITALTPVHLLTSPFDLERIVISSSLNIPGGIGVLVYCACLFYCRDVFTSDRGRRALAVTAIPSLILIFVFSNHAVPAIHGLQVIAPLLVMAAACRLHRDGAVAQITVAGLQIAVNIACLVLYLFMIGVFQNPPAWIDQLR